MIEKPIYLDGFSTTPLAPEALRAMELAWREPGNAGSPHAGGRRAASVLQRGREQVASLIGCLPTELIFTSGATEANNLALRGLADWAFGSGEARRRIVVSAIEHKAVLETAHRLVKLGFVVEEAPVTAQGVVDLDRLADLVDDRTLLVSIMMVNNETGVVQPVERASAIAHGCGALFHCDAAQAAGKIPLNVFDLDIDYLSLSSHKLYGPMGVGALYVAGHAPKPVAQNLGGGQERGLRSGTEPVPLVAGFGAAAALAVRSMEAEGLRARAMVSAFLQALQQANVEFAPVSGGAVTVSGGFALSFSGLEADDLVSRVGSDLCVSTGSACTSGQILSSHVLTAMGMSQTEAARVVRFYFSRYNREEEVSRAANILSAAIASARSGLDDPASARYGAEHEACADRP